MLLLADLAAGWPSLLPPLLLLPLLTGWVSLAGTMLSLTTPFRRAAAGALFRPSSSLPSSSLPSIQGHPKRMEQASAEVAE